tara:strand:+ start:4307 stop:5605 length:1299 start_codon:yes stop_codon:yes gene_type:complete
MLKKIKNIALKTDSFLFKTFGTDKSIKLLENIKEAQIIFSYLNEIGTDAKVRFVGGCVRKALCGQQIDDIDLATSLEPNEVKDKLVKKGVKVIDTGITHGTVTAFLNKKKFEITTLRKDIRTDGRHAEVKFTSNWEEDASRRDFTINAIYADINGRIFDPLNGIDDLRNGHIKFIGSPDDRIREDYLRILRFFRFFIQYSQDDCDKNVIQSIKENINGLNEISNERIFSELTKILKLKNLSNLFFNNHTKEIIINIFPQFKYYKRLKNINKLSQKIKNLYDIHLILALLIVDESSNYEYFCYKYKTSNKIKKRLENIFNNLDVIKMKKFYSEQNFKKMIYFTSKDEVKDLLLFSICLKNKTKVLDVEKLIDYINTCKVPKFPVSGDYLKNHGYKTGQALGKKIKLLEEKWIENNFIMEKNFLDKHLIKSDKN